MKWRWPWTRKLVRVLEPLCQVRDRVRNDSDYKPNMTIGREFRLYMNRKTGAKVKGTDNVGEACRAWNEKLDEMGYPPAPNHMD